MHQRKLRDNMQNKALSAADIRVLKLVQHDIGLSKQDIADAAAMSPATLWRRINDLETEGVIRKRVALLDAEKVGLPVCVFLSVNLKNYEEKLRESFHTFVETTPEIMECFSVTGGFDYMLIVRTKSVAAFEEFLMNKILRHKSIATASSQISLRQQKYTTQLPL